VQGEHALSWIEFEQESKERERELELKQAVE
jgi:hypothetical protein